MASRFMSKIFLRSKKCMCSLHFRDPVYLRTTVFRRFCTSTYHNKLSHHPPFTYPDIPSDVAAKNLIVQLDDRGRSLLMEELVKFQEEKQRSEGKSNAVDVPGSELRKVLFFNGFPFIAFGFLDNMVMILAGEYIDVTLGAAFGISTMAAAALGNLISDVAGIGSAGYVEVLVSKVGIHPPNITPVQALHWKSRWCCALGRAIGISIGCLIGMFPLLFFKHDKDNETCTAKTDETKDNTVASSQQTNQKPNESVSKKS